MSRTRRFIDGVFFSYVNQIVVMVVGLWLTPFLLKHLGKHDFGLWLIGLQILSYLTLLDIGVVGLLPREVAFAKGRIIKGEGTEVLRRLIEEVFVVILSQVPFLILAGLGVWLMLPNDPVIRPAATLVLVTFTLQFPTRTFYAALEGLQELGFLGRLQFAAWATGLVVNVSTVMAGGGLYGVASGWTATTAVIAAGSIWRFYALYPQYTPRTIRRLPWRDHWKYLSGGLWISIGQIADAFKSSEMLLIGRFVSPAAVVSYACTTKLGAVMSNQPLIIMQSAQPGLSELRVAGDRSHMARVVGSLTQAMLMLSGAVAVVVLATNRSFVLKWVGQEQYLGIWITLAALVTMMLRHWNITTLYTLFCFGLQRHNSTVSIVEGIANLIFAAGFILLFGPIGAPLGGIAAVLFVSLPWNLTVLRREMGYPLSTLLAPLRAWVGPFLGAAILAGFLGQRNLPATYAAVVLGALAAAGGYALLEWPVVTRSHWAGALQTQFSLLRSRFKRTEPEPTAAIL